MSTNHEIGLWGEKQAALWLQKAGYRLLDSRYRCREGEIDLVASKEGFLCFIEVKLRKNDRMGLAREYVTYRKQQKIRTAALYYLSEHPTVLQPRFDVVEVYAPCGVNTEKPDILIWPNAF